jgi:hypothetical protein
MYFPAGKPNALDILRAYAHGPVDRDMVEAALDFYIMLEPDELGNNGADTLKFDTEIARAYRIMRQYGQQAEPKTIENLQELFYSFSNSDKYRYNITTISVVRLALNDAWAGLYGWLA